MGQPFLICPHSGCDAEDDVKEVEVVTHWNNVRLNPGHDGVVVSDGYGDDPENQRYECGTCYQPVSFPKNIAGNRDWA